MMIESTNIYDVHRPILADSKHIQVVSTVNYLGVILDRQLTYTPYYNMVKRRMENKIFVLSKIRKYNYR